MKNVLIKELYVFLFPLKTFFIDQKHKKIFTKKVYQTLMIF